MHSLKAGARIRPELFFRRLGFLMLSFHLAAKGPVVAPLDMLLSNEALQCKRASRFKKMPFLFLLKQASKHFKPRSHRFALRARGASPIDLLRCRDRSPFAALAKIAATYQSSGPSAMPYPLSRRACFSKRRNVFCYHKSSNSSFEKRG